jgi:hypothetical protein
MNRSKADTLSHHAAQCPKGDTMSKTFVDYSALVATAFGRSLVEELRLMSREQGAREEEVRAYLYDRVAQENERRASQGVRTLHIAGIAA